MGVTPQGTDNTVVPTHADVAAMDVDESEVVSAYIPPTTKTSGIPAKAYPGQTVWCPPQSSHSVMSTNSRPISYSPGDFTAEPAPEPEHEGSLGTGATASGHLGPDPVPKKARGPVGDTRPLAIVLPNGEALWFTTRDIDADTPRLVIPWSLFQYIAMSKRPLSGFQSWGKVGVLYIRRVAQDILHGAQQRVAIMDRIREANRSNPLLLDLNSAYPEPHDGTPPISACTGAHRPSFNFRDFLQRPHLGGHFGPGEGPPVQAEEHSRVSTTSPLMRCRWQHQLERRTMLRTAWDCGPNGSWDRRTQALPLRAYRPRLHPMPLLHRRHHPLQLTQPNQLQKKLKMMMNRMWNLQWRKRRKWQGLRRSVLPWNGE